MQLRWVTVSAGLETLLRVEVGEGVSQGHRDVDLLGEKRAEKTVQGREVLFGVGQLDEKHVVVSDLLSNIWQLVYELVIYLQSCQFRYHGGRVHQHFEGAAHGDVSVHTRVHGGSQASQLSDHFLRIVLLVKVLLRHSLTRRRLTFQVE